MPFRPIAALLMGLAASPAMSAPLQPNDPPPLPENLDGFRFINALVVTEGNHPLEGFHHFFLNDRGWNRFHGGGARPYPEGTVFVDLMHEVKREGGLSNEGGPRAILLMQKDRSAAETGGWRFGAYQPDGKPIAIDAKSACFECHTAVKDQDYVYSRPLELNTAARQRGKMPAGTRGSFMGRGPAPESERRRAD